MARQNKDKKVDRFTVNVVESGTHKALHSYKFTRLTAALFFTNAFIMLCLIIFVLVAYTPLKTFIPGYPDAMSKRDAVNNAIKVDSLERVIYKWELYSENIRRVLQGDETIDIQSIITIPDTASCPVRPRTFLRRGRVLMLFRRVLPPHTISWPWCNPFSRRFR